MLMEYRVQNFFEVFYKKKYLYLLYFWVVLVFGIILAYFIVSSGKVITGLKVAGIKIGGIPIAQASKALAFRLDPRTDRKITLFYNNRALTVVPSAIGIRINIPATVNQAYRVGRTGPLWTRFITRGRAYRRGMDIEPVFQYNRNTLDSFYRLLDAIIAVEPIRSVITVNRQGEISYTPSRTGRAIDRRRLTRLLEKAVASPKHGLIKIPVVDIVPPLTENDINQWGLNKIMGIYSTQFDPSKPDRVQNLKTACSALDNSLIYPGQNFSFNTWVGPRVTEAGYKEAPVIFMGKLVPGVGGGVCQVSSTLYNAVLLSNLKIIQRFNHSLPSTYVPIGRDATVVYGGIDFIFENANQNPILIVAKVESPFVTIAVLGAKAGWDKIILEAKTIETYPFSVKEIPDPALPKKTKVKVQEGLNGYKVELRREIFQSNGESRKELLNTSIYPSQPEEYKIGTKN
jgi:vancomycin resistance protein YoaR